MMLFSVFSDSHVVAKGSSNRRAAAVAVVLQQWWWKGPAAADVAQLVSLWLTRCTWTFTWVPANPPLPVCAMSQGLMKINNKNECKIFIYPQNDSRLKTVENASVTYSTIAKAAPLPPAKLFSLLDCKDRLADTVAKDFGLHLTHVTDV
jgi:hypothetical protein